MGWVTEESGFEFSNSNNFIFSTMSKHVLGRIQPPIQWVPGALSMEVKQPGHEAYHSTTSAEITKTWIYLYMHLPIRLYVLVLNQLSAGTAEWM
jgi:hypothetical protein